MDWLLDTNILSELRRRRPHPAVQQFIAETNLDQIYTSIICLAEIRFGIEASADPLLRITLLHWLTDRIRPMFAGRVLGIDEDVMLRWRVLMEQGRKIGRTYSQPDLFLAATALEHNLILVTRNTRDFDDLGVMLHNPWAA